MHWFQFLRVSLVSFSLLLVLVAGCSKGRAYGTVRGRVTLNGKPVTGALLIITHRATRQSFIERVNSSGEFVVQPPVLVGMCTIKLRAEEGDPSATPIPEKYRKENTSGLEVEVKEGLNEYDLKLDGAPTE